MQAETAQILDDAGRFGNTFSGNTARRIVEARAGHLESLIKRIVAERREGVRFYPTLSSKEHLQPLKTRLFQMIDEQTSGIPENMLAKLDLKGWDRLPAQYPARLRDTVIIELKKLELEAKVNPPVSAERPIYQTVFGNVGQMAGRDMNTNVTVVALLGALEKAIQESPEIPENEKGELLSKIRDLSSNPWVVALGTGGLLEILKALV